MKGIKKIKNYILTKELGRGANGTVYEAVDEASNKLVAIKAIAQDKINNPRVNEQFKKELKTLYRISNKNIIKINGVEKTANNVYLILEYCNGGTLLDYTHYNKNHSKKRISELIVQKIIKQVIEGLKYMHKIKIIHRDIKLENILINFDDFSDVYSENNIKSPKELYSMYDLENCKFTVKIADLGYAKDLEGCSGASTICGTPITMAPEICQRLNQGGIINQEGNVNKYNSEIDLWSLGAVLYELLIGAPLFLGNGAVDIINKVKEGFYEIPSNICISIESIYLLNGLLQFDPKKRLTWDQIVYHPFVIKDAKNFKYIKLNSVKDDKGENLNLEKLKINSRDCSNFLWIMFKACGASLPFELDELDKETYQEVLNDILANEISKEDQNNQENPINVLFDINKFNPNDKILINNKDVIKEESLEKQENPSEYESVEDEFNLLKNESVKLKQDQQIKNFENSNINNQEKLYYNINNQNNFLDVKLSESKVKDLAKCQIEDINKEELIQIFKDDPEINIDFEKQEPKKEEVQLDNLNENVKEEQKEFGEKGKFY